MSLRTWISFCRGLSQDAAEDGDHHRHEAGEYECGQKAKPERQDDEDTGTACGSLRGHRPVGPQVVGKSGKSAGERAAAVAGANGRRNQPVGARHVGQVRPRLLRIRPEPQGPADPIEPLAQRTAKRIGDGGHGPIHRRTRTQRGGQQICPQRQVGDGPQPRRPHLSRLTTPEEPIGPEPDGGPERHGPPAPDQHGHTEPAGEGDENARTPRRHGSPTLPTGWVALEPGQPLTGNPVPKSRQADQASEDKDKRQENQLTSSARRAADNAPSPRGTGSTRRPPATDTGEADERLRSVAR